MNTEASPERLDCSRGTVRAIEVRLELEDLVVQDLVPGSQAEELGVSIGSRIAAIDGVQPPPAARRAEHVRQRLDLPIAVDTAIRDRALHDIVDFVLAEDHIAVLIGDAVIRA